MHQLGKNNKHETSNLAKHLLECGYRINNTDDNLEIMKFCDKRKIITWWEHLYIQSTYKEKCYRLIYLN